MYRDHFGLHRPPFRITPDTSLFFEGSQRGATLEALHYAIMSGEGIVKVVGEVGSGKTMLCRMLELRLENASVDVVYIANPNLSPDNILHVIAHELRLDIDDVHDKVDLMQKIQAYLLRKHAEGERVVLFVEEAQCMPVETLEEIRLLSNLETDYDKLMQMVLFGQPELDEKLAKPHIRQLKERITHSFYLTPFAPEDIHAYLGFRLREVGYRGIDLFGNRTVALIKRYSGGLTRRINILADKALMAAYAEGAHRVSARHIRLAAMDSEFVADVGGSATPVPGMRRVQSAAAIVLAALLFAGGIWLGRTQPLMMDGEPVMRLTAASAVATGAGRRPDVARPPADPEETASLAARETGGNDDGNDDGRKVAHGIDGGMAMERYLTRRINATTQWLASADERHYSIQLLLARKGNRDAVENLLKRLADEMDAEKIFIYETTLNGEAWYSVVYDEFSDMEAARRKLAGLPARLKKSGPYLRRLAAVRKEVSWQGQDGKWLTLSGP